MSREAYQRKRAENYKRFSGAIVQYQATASIGAAKKYLQYFMIDTAITPVLRKLFETAKGKKLQDCDPDELSGRLISEFIDAISDQELLHMYQLHHGPEGSDEFIAARALFTSKAQCSFEVSLADAANAFISQIRPPMAKILSWSEEHQLPPFKDHGLWNTDKLQIVYKDEDLTRDDFIVPGTAEGTIEPQLDSSVGNGPGNQEPTIKNNDVLEQFGDDEIPVHHKFIKDVEERDAAEQRVEKLEHAATLRKVVLTNRTVQPQTLNIPERQDQQESIQRLKENGFDLGIYAPCQSGKDVYLKGRRHQILDTEEFKYQAYDNVKRIAQKGIITSDVELAAMARTSLAIVPTWDVYRYRHYKVRLKVSKQDYLKQLNTLGRYDYVLLSNKYVSQAMALVD